MSSKYPEHEKLRAVEKERLIISEFLEFLEYRDLSIGCLESGPIKGSDIPRYKHFRPEDLMAEFFEIDLKRLEEEKRDMLTDLPINKREKKRHDCKKEGHCFVDCDDWNRTCIHCGKPERIKCDSCRKIVDCKVYTCDDCGTTLCMSCIEERLKIDPDDFWQECNKCGGQIAMVRL